MAAAEYVDVDMIHGLHSVRFTVNDDAAALFGAALSGEQGLRPVEELAQKGAVFRPGFHDIGYMPFGDHQKMKRGLR